MGTFRQYYSLTKPGVLYGNVITGAAGFLFASGYFKHFELTLFIAVLVGMTLVIASACALNNYLDKDIDSIMQRTKKRAVASGAIRGRNAVLFAVVLGVSGIVVLAAWVNLLVVVIGLFGFVDYVLLYGVLAKRLSIHGTLVGSISGAMPILAGYCAVSNRIDAGAILVFLALFFWQMPEFYSISIYRRAEYKAAGVPVMSVVKGVRSTTIQIFAYTIAFVAMTLLLTVFGYAGWVYFAVMALLGIFWIRLGAQGLVTKHSSAWARRMFHFSLIILLAFSAMLAIGPLVP
ncbi:MAG TPA: heme o synthase [Candidatus Saccharimonadales bacterium]|nr:heme o synthase [Candidatus Saccharimonadales bacterium]